MEAFDTSPPERVLDDAIARTEIRIERLHQRIEQLSHLLKSMALDGSISKCQRPRFNGRLN
jgi:hypothetical protein